MDFLYLHDNRDLSLMSLAKSFIKDLKQYSYKALNNDTKIKSIAWTAAFGYRAPNTMMKIVCNDCNSEHIDKACNIGESSQLSKHFNCNNWEIRKAGNSIAKSSKSEARLEALELKVERLETLVDKLTIK